MTATTHSEPAHRWQGFHHVALVTPDLDATRRFYGETLGMELGPILPASEYSGRHCFIRPGATGSWGLHFFEQPDVPLYPYPEEMPRSAFVPGALQHIAFALENRQAADLLRARLEQFGIVATPVNTIGPIENMLFRDNNGLLLEAAWPSERASSAGPRAG